MELTTSYKETEVGRIPADWVVKSCSEMGDVVAGKALNANGSGEKRPYLRTKNVLDGQIDLDDVLQMPFTESEFKHYQLQYGDVLLNEGQTLELVGRCSMYRDEHPGACGMQNQLVRFRAKDGVSAEFAEHLFRYCQREGTFQEIATQTTSVAHLGVSRFRDLRLAWPSKESEQRAIAAALSDVDALIERLDALVAKKRAVKTAAMQRLLIGTQRLPGFSGAWATKRLGDLLTVRHGKSQWQVEQEGGEFPILATSGEIGRASQPLYEKPSVLIGRKGTIDRPQYQEQPFWTIDTLFYTEIAKSAHPKFVFYRFCLIDWLSHNEASGVPSLNASTIENIRVRAPMREEQRAIAEVLSAMDAEIEALQARRAKTQALKRGMMQELLTGRTRIIDS